MNTWNTARSFEHAYIRNIEDETGEIIAQVLDLDDYPNDIKRARLIAAAPDLLAALKDAIETMNEHGLTSSRTAEDAIAKAEGEGA